MRRDNVFLLACLLVLIVPLPAWAQRIRDAADLLNKVKETYSSLKSFQVEGVMSTESQSVGMQAKMDLPFEADFAAPNKMRMEMKNPLVAILVVSDGRAAWMYFSSTKTYSRIDLGDLRRFGAGSEADEGREAFMGFSAAAGVPFDILQSTLTYGMKHAAISGEEDVELEGMKIPCYVVQVEYAREKGAKWGPSGSKSYWIDKGRFVVLRDSFQTHVDSGMLGAPQDLHHTTSLTRFKLNEPVPDEVFEFTPPEGAKEAEGNAGWQPKLEH